MKKLLIGAAAVAMGLSLAAPAQAQVNLDLGGHFKGYGSWVDQDEAPGMDVRDLDIIRETEIHFTGETTLDNGLTVGFHAEADIDDAGGDAFTTEEAYAYFSGAWGRVNFGKEDGAAYLLQIAAPSADSNVDGIRQYVGGFNGFGTGVDYDHAATGYANKFTYLTPVFNGFQAGFSYTPDIANGGTGGSNQFGNSLDDQINTFGEAYEAAARYEGQFGEVGLALGAGYSILNLEEETAAPGGGEPADDVKTWNVGIDMNWGAFGLGAVYLDSSTDEFTGAGLADEGLDDKTWVIGLDYTTGPFKLGASYLNNEVDVLGGGEIETDRYTGGVTYTYGPGMTFRGSISYVEVDAGAGADVDGTNVLLGTQIDF